MGYRFLATSILSWMAVTEGASEAAHSNLRRNTSKEEREGCPRCDEIFSMVETTSSGELVQQIDMQERGKAAPLQRHPRSCGRTFIQSERPRIPHVG